MRNFKNTCFYGKYDRAEKGYFQSNQIKLKTENISRDCTI